MEATTNASKNERLLLAVQVMPTAILLLLAMLLTLLGWFLLSFFFRNDKLRSTSFRSHETKAVDAVKRHERTMTGHVSGLDRARETVDAREPVAHIYFKNYAAT